MTVTQLINELQRIKKEGLPKGHIVDCGLSEPITILGPLEDGGREVLHEIELD